MSPPTPNNGPDNNLFSGPPMVKIDGAAVRRIREEHGLTQLYVATVVQVTTDTISRWENRRYPSIKKENAEKLAEALGVGLGELLEREEEPAVPAEPPPPAADTELQVPQTPTPPPQATSRHRAWRLPLLLVAALALLAALWYRWPGQPEALPPVASARILPSHVPPGQDFPVLLRISSPPPTSFALIVRENIPPGCRLNGASPAATGPVGRAGQITWVSRLEGGERLFAYRLTSPAAAIGTVLHFQGQVVAGGRSDRPTAITGPDQMSVSPFHWADRNGDNRIDDEEILWVYDIFGSVEGFDDLRDEVDRLWIAGGYRWDATAGRYLLLN